MSAAGHDRPTKLCPDCAESVLAAARKCRFCGYRFSGPEAVADDNSGGGPFAILRRPSRQLTMTGYLAQAGIELEDDEQPVGMWLGRIDGADAYVVVTNVRLFVTEVGLRQKRPSLTDGYLLSDLVHVEVVHRRRKSTLVIDWQRSASTVVTKLSTNDLEVLHSILLTGRRGYK